jgi:predicted phosphodiesterase
VLYGHSHIPEISQHQGILFVNPGHLKDSDKKGYSASYAVLEVADDEIVASLVDAETGRPIQEVTHRRP